MYILQILHQHIFRQYDQLFLNLKTNEEGLKLLRLFAPLNPVLEAYL